MTIGLHLLRLESLTGLGEESSEFKDCEGCALYLSVCQSLYPSTYLRVYTSVF